MAYTHDIFISYRRHPETLGWIKNHFLPLLELHVGLELGNNPKIYVNEVTHEIAAGTVWPQALAQELGASKVLVALWTKTFFNSVWCTEEMSHMLIREDGTLAPRNKYALVIPAIIHDGDDFPKTLDVIQKLDIKACFNPRMRKDSALAEELSDRLAANAAGVAGAILNAPPWNAAWPQQAAKKFFDAFYAAAAPEQTDVPKFQPT